MPKWKLALLTLLAVGVSGGALRLADELRLDGETRAEMQAREAYWTQTALGCVNDGVAHRTSGPGWVTQPDAGRIWRVRGAGHRSANGNYTALGIRGRLMSYANDESWWLCTRDGGATWCIGPTRDGAPCYRSTTGHPDGPWCCVCDERHASPAPTVQLRE